MSIKVMASNIISVGFTAAKFLLLKVRFGKRFSFSGIQRFSISTEISIRKGAKIILHKRVKAYTGTKLMAIYGGVIEVGENAAFNRNCLLACQKQISIGEGTEFGPGVLVYDHDHDFRQGLRKNEYKCSPVTIGKNVWIGAYSVILRGTTLGDGCVVGAGSVIKGIYPPNSIIVQKRDEIIKPYEIATGE